MTTSTKLTTMESQVLESVSDGDWFCEVPTVTFSDIIDETEINPKQVRGVISSLVKKGLVELSEYPNGQTAVMMVE